MSSLVLTATYGAIDLTSYPYALEFGADFGAPQNVTEVLAMLLQDGEIEMTERTSNRTIEFNLIVEGSDMAALADAEAALMLEARKDRNELTIDPGDGFGPATVYDTFRAQVAWLRDDNHEINGLRRYSLTIKALPAGRSAAEVVTTALAASGTTTTLVNNGSTTTNWTGAVNGVSSSPSVVSGAVKVASGSAAGSVTVSATLTTSITTSSTKYLVVDWKPESANGNPDLRAYGDGTELTRVAQLPSPTSGYTRTTFYVAASSIAVLRLDSTSSTSTGGFIGYVDPSVRSLYVDNINRSDVKPAIGTGRQLLRSIEVAGTARTQGSLAIEHGSSALGDVLAYVYSDTDANGGPVAYSPPLRQYRSGGGTVTSDSTKVSGGIEDITSVTATFDVPVAKIISGTHLLMVRLGASTPVSALINWSAQTWLSGTTVGGAVSGSQMVSVSSIYTMFPLGLVTLPVKNVDPSSAVVRISLSSPAGSAVNLDEGWAFNLQIGQLMQVGCGSGSLGPDSGANRMWVDPATAANPLPMVRIGTAADRSDSYFPSAIPSWQPPQFIPPRVNVLTVTTNALDAAVSLRHYPRWELNAAS